MASEWGSETDINYPPLEENDEHRCAPGCLLVGSHTDCITLPSGMRACNPRCAAGQVVEVRMPKRFTETPVVVQRHDQRAEDATYENEFTMNGER